MDFEETEWHSDVKTDTLVTSLFGTSCEKSKKKNNSKKSTTLNYDTVEGYREYLLSRQPMIDDADAVVSKKQRKRMKEKIRKKNKRAGDGCEEEESNFSDDMTQVVERYIKERHSTVERMFKKSCERPKILNKQLHDGTVQNDATSKKRKVKCIVEDAFTNLNSPCLLYTDNSAQNCSKLKKRKVKTPFVENTCKISNSRSSEISGQSDTIRDREHTVSDKDTASENAQKLSNKLKRKRLCKHNKYKHLVKSNGEQKSITVLSDEMCNSNISDEKIKCKLVEDQVANDSKSFNRSVEKSKNCKGNEKSLSLLKDKKDRKRKLGDGSSKEICRSINIHEFDSVRTKKRKKGLEEKLPNNPEEIVTNLENTTKTCNESEKRNGLRTKHKTKEMLERKIDTKMHTPGKNKLHFNVEKMKAHLGIKNMVSNEKVNQKLKSDKNRVLKSFETGESHMDIHFSNKKKVNNSSTSHVDFPKKQSKKNISLHEKMIDRLSSARFRYLSEQMYTQTGSEAKMLFENDMEAFQVYHEGYQAQVRKWPQSPVDVIIKEIQKQSADLVVADFGCGEAVLAQSVPNIVHSFDLVALNERVMACDMAQVPLSTGSVDIAVFCLSLMGTNLTDYLCEASRVLKKGGLLKIAEVASRFNEPSRFVQDVKKMGFRLSNKNTNNKMFYLFDFVKTGNVKKGSVPQIELNPCLYKRR